MKKKLIVIIPGNPYLPGIYDQFADYLASSKYVVKVQPHLGQADRERRKFQSITIEDLIADHTLQLTHTLQEAKYSEIFLIGHSLGALIATRISTPKMKLLLLFPFLELAQKNKKLVQLINKVFYRKVFNALAFFVLRLPMKVKKHLFLKLGAGERTKMILASLARNKFHLANFMATIKNYPAFYGGLRIEDYNNLKRKNRHQFIYGKNDFWAPEDQVERLDKAFKVQMVEGVDHNFCVYNDQSKKVAGLILKML